ncbi:MAG: amidohydrolase [Gemmatimonadaceae bacterium]|nr:amidohydrolase [Gemmatimonadaceae bacterium]
MADLRVLLVQPDTIWHDPAANRAQLADVVRAQAATDLIVLPETFTTGFSNEAIANAESMDGESVAWMRALATERDAAVTGSIQIRSGDAVHNRLVFVTPSGALWHYDKRHLFRMAGEHDRYAAGRERLIVEWRDWRICPMVCYDLRFPIFARNRVDASRGGDLEYDVLVYVANWPAARHEAWRTLLRARAMENLCYVVGVNRTGVDGNGHAHRGGSIATDPVGVAIADCDEAPQATHAVLSLDRLREHRRRFPAHLDADRFILHDA